MSVKEIEGNLKCVKRMDDCTGQRKEREKTKYRL